MLSLDCQHVSTAAGRRVCRHLLEQAATEYLQCFTGRGLKFHLICPACSKDRVFEHNLRTVCQQCYETIEREAFWGGIAGQPEVLERPSGLCLRHDTIFLEAVVQERLLDIQPIQSLDRNLWIAVTQSGKLLRLDLDQREAIRVDTLPDGMGTLSDPVSLHLSRTGEWAAIVNTKGQTGLVTNLDSGQKSMPLQRDDYHNAHCTFPVAFFEHEGRTLLIHGTGWNRLDISDPLTGRSLTERDHTSHRSEEKRPEHYLDYFHCGLSLSPDQRQVADNGWVWHPVGIVTTWSLQRWLQDNVWEAEDGESKRSLCYRDYYWDGPLCWLGDRQLAVWGYGRDDQWLIPAVRIFDVVSDQEERWFAGPQGQLTFDGYLFSFDSTAGFAVWDVATGERLLRADSFCPFRYHPGAKLFLTPLPDGRFQITRLRGQRLDSSLLTWADGTIVHLAQAIYEEGAFDRLPVLADALEEAGCQDSAMLTHCRQPGPHAKECWVLERILDQE